jgi:hypothetical protein
VLLPLPGLGRGEEAESLVLAEAAAVVEGLDEGEDLGAGGVCRSKIRFGL